MGDDWQLKLRDEVDALSEWMISLRRDLHANPEVSGQEFRTTEVLQRALQAKRIVTRSGAARRGLLAQPAEQRDHGAMIAIRGDMDALPLVDEKTTEYRSRKQGVMHACGHDAHCAAAAGAMAALAALADAERLPWPIRWRGVLQPAEETGEGAPEMMELGALEDVAAIIALHVDPTRDLGRVGVRSGSFTASADAVDITVRGRGGHAARPHESLDAVAGAAHLVNAIYSLLPRAVDLHDPAVVSFGRIEAGVSRNVLPDHVCLEGTLRTLSPAVREDVQRRLRRLASGAAEASGLEIDLDFHSGMPPVRNDPRLTALLERAARSVVGDEAIEQIPLPSMGAEDFGFYLKQVPGAMFRLGVRSGESTSHPLHSPQFDMDERALAVGAKVLATAVVLWFDPEGEKYGVQ